jgi:RHS repeat-associated protein
LTTINLFPGDHSITAYYSGDSNFSNGTSNAVTQTVIPTVNPPIYSYVITPTGGPSGYSPNGNVTAYTDSVMGTWSLGYDALNRLTSANASPAVEGNSSYQWFYDSFGNRLTETGNMGTNIWTQSGNDSNGVPHNQVAPTTPGWPATNARGVAWTPQYDAAGDMQTDGANQYLYDADGRVCAVMPLYGGSWWQYLYDASGKRVAKGTITTWSCNTAQNGFTLTNQYIIGPNGEQMTEMAVSGGTSTWLHTNVYAGGVVATYLSDGAASPHFRFADWLGTTRVQVNSSGNTELTCQSLPFGDPLLPCTATTATEQFFTGQERDQESGNDYFQARHYSNSMGSFLSPDPSGLYYADSANPQSFNLYSYVRNNPLINVDPTGLDCLYFNNDGSLNRNEPGDCDSPDDDGHYVDGTVDTSSLKYNPITGNYLYNYTPYDDDDDDDDSGPPTIGTGVLVGVGDPITITVPIADYVLSWAGSQTTPLTPGFPWTYGHWAGPGGRGIPVNDVDAGAMVHDYCYAHAQGGPLGPSSNLHAHNAALQACNQQLCDAMAPIAAGKGQNMDENVDGSLGMTERNAAKDIIDFFTYAPFHGNGCHKH